jgi:DNA-directed RNA polymerase II subunit RPB1
MPPGGSGQPLAVSSKETRKALALRLGILGDEEVVRMSVTPRGITNEQLLDRRGQPQAQGVHDPRMGTTDRDAYCGTCGCDSINCPGHFGHIALA